MSGLVILQSSQEAPTNHATSRASKIHTVSSILGDMDFDPNTHTTTMIPFKASGQACNGEEYSIHYYKSVSSFTEDSQR